MMPLLVDSTVKITEIGSCELLSQQHGKRPRVASSILLDGNTRSTVNADKAARNEKSNSRDFNVVQHKQRTTCSREHSWPGCAFRHLAKPAECPRAQLDSDNQAFGEAEAMAEDEKRFSPRSLSRFSSEALTRHSSRISTERLHTFRTSSASAFEDMSPAFRHAQLAAPASTSATTRGVTAGTDMRAPACGPSRIWCSLPTSQPTCHKGSERPGQGSPRESKRSGSDSGSLEHIKAHRGNLALTSCDLTSGLSQGRTPPGDHQLDGCSLHGLSGGDSPSGNRCSFSITGREMLQTTMGQCDSASNSARRDLQLYMKTVREK